MPQDGISVCVMWVCQVDLLHWVSVIHFYFRLAYPFLVRCMLNWIFHAVACLRRCASRLLTRAVSRSRVLFLHPWCASKESGESHLG